MNLKRDEFIDRIKRVLTPEAYFYIGAHGDVYVKSEFGIIELACFMDDEWVMKKSINTKEE